MASNAPKTVHSLVLDSGPIIKNEPQVSTLLGQAEVLYTIPAVIDEIRDAATRARVESTLLPFLTIRSPKPGSVNFIQNFAKKTGDLEVLSRPDLHLLALTYELECERNHGDWRLRSVPGQKRLNGAPPASLEASILESIEVNDTANSKENSGVGLHELPAQEDIPQIVGDGEKISSTESTRDVNSTSIEHALENLNLTVQEIPPSEDSPNKALETTQQELVLGSDLSLEADPNCKEEASDREGWMTPSNLKRHQQNDGTIATTSSKNLPKTLQVALITTDFAMQNVLLRLNLNLLSLSLQRISHLKTWVLRCHGCFSVTKDMTKQFCGRCGKPTLLRTSCSTDKDGNFKIHLKKNMQWSTRGNVYSIPKPVAGSSNGKIVSGGGKGGWGNSLILAEDQKEFVRAVIGERRMRKKDLMDEDYLPALLSGDRGRVGGRPKVGAGRNVNSKKRK